MKTIKRPGDPKCDLCKRNGHTKDAEYDSPTHGGPWAYLCEDHFQTHGAGTIGTKFEPKK
jgi:hypothetical protein